MFVEAFFGITKINPPRFPFRRLEELRELKGDFPSVPVFRFGSALCLAITLLKLLDLPRSLFFQWPICVQRPKSYSAQQQVGEIAGGCFFKATLFYIFNAGLGAVVVKCNFANPRPVKLSKNLSL